MEWRSARGRPFRRAKSAAPTRCRSTGSAAHALGGLRPAGDGGATSLVALVEEGRREVEMRLPGKCRLSPPLAAALRTLPGIVQVEFA